MLILAILSVATWLLDMVFDIIFALLPFSTMPDIIIEYVDKFFNVLELGVNLFFLVIGPVGTTLIKLVIAFQALYFTWNVIWFVIRKIKLSE